MAGDYSVWRMVLLSVIYLADLVVFIGLCREELRSWHAERARRPASRKPMVRAGQQARAH